MYKQRDYRCAYQNLSIQFTNLKRLIGATKLNFEDADLNKIKDTLLEYSIPEKGDMLINLKDTQNFIKPINDLLHTKILDTNDFELLNMLVERFSNDLNQVIEDLKLECIKNDWAEGLLKLIEPDTVNQLDTRGNTLLMHATSLHCPSMKVINKLLELKADPFIPCSFRKTPFSTAVNDGHLTLAQKYLRHKADLLDESQLSVINQMINKLCDSLLPEDFYFTLAQDLSDSSFTEALGWDSSTTRTCFRYIRDNYEILGKNIDDLPYEFHT